MNYIRLFTFLAILLQASVSFSATVYVDNCTNAITTYNPATRACTGGSATVYSNLNNANASITAGTSTESMGDTVIIRGGTYTWDAQTINKAYTTWQAYTGEEVVIDGAFVRPTTGGTYTYSALLTISGDGIVIDGIKVYRSRGRGFTLWKSNGTLSGSSVNATLFNVTMRNCNGDLANREVIVPYYTDNVTIEDSEFSRGSRGFAVECCYSRTNACGTGVTCPWGDPATFASPNNNNLTLRRCKVRDGHNEGLNIGQYGNGTVVEYCQIYGNNKGQLYVVSASNITIRYNLIYGVNSNYNGEISNDGWGIWLSAESQWVNDSSYTGIVVYGNFVANTASCFWINAQETSTFTPTVDGVVIYNNTFAYPSGAYNINIDHTDGSGHTFRNNIVLGSGTSAIAYNTGVGAMSSVGYNLWSSLPASTYMRGTGDVTGSPTLEKTSGWNSLTGGSLSVNDFKLQTGSEGIDDGVTLSAPYNSDYWGTIRTTFDIGAHELTTGATCPGNGCESRETCETCPQDCGACPETDNLIIYYPMDTGDLNGTNLTDHSGNNQTGTVDGSPGALETGLWGQAMRFDGSNDRVSRTPSPWITGDASFCFAANSDTDTSGRVLTKHSGTSGQYGWVIRRLLATDSFQFGYSTNGTSWTFVSAGDDIWPISTNQHFCVVKSSTTINLYQNGSLYTGGSWPASETGTFFNSSSPLYVGFDPEGSVYFDGLIDDVRVYDKALTAAEVQDIYLQAEGTDKLRWTMDSISGSTVNDTATWSFRDGTIIGSATTTTGKVNNGISLNGSSQAVNGPEITGLKDGDFTIRAWGKPNVLNVNQHIAGSDYNWYRMYLASDGRLIGVTYDTAARTGICPDTISTSAFSQFVLRKSGSQMSVWHDGAQCASWTTGTIGDDSPFTVGAANSTWSNRQWFNGVIDEVAVDSRAWTDAEIVADYGEINVVSVNAFNSDSKSGVLTEGEFTAWFSYDAIGSDIDCTLSSPGLTDVVDADCDSAPQAMTFTTPGLKTITLTASDGVDSDVETVQIRIWVSTGEKSFGTGGDFINSTALAATFGDPELGFMNGEVLTMTEDVALDLSSLTSLTRISLAGVIPSTITGHGLELLLDMLNHEVTNATWTLNNISVKNVRYVH